MAITSIETWIGSGDDAPEAPGWGDDRPIASAMERFGIRTLADWPAEEPGGGLIVEVTADDGTSGLGRVHGGISAAIIVKYVLAPALVGRPAAERDAAWDVMHAVTQGAGGVALAAISGIDLALWDLAGRRSGQPVRRLLNERAADALRVYATVPAAEPFADRGFEGIKVCPPSGSLAAVRSSAAFLRQQAGCLAPGCFFAVDTYLGGTEASIVALAEQCEAIAVRWWEEPLPPRDLAGLRRLRKAGLPIAAGEHLEPWSLAALLDAEAVDVLQPELRAYGGITPLLGVWRRATEAGVDVIPHAGGVFAYETVAALSARVPLAEASFFGAPVGTGLERRSALLGEYPTPVDGSVALGNAPGFGIELDREAVRPAPV